MLPYSNLHIAEEALGRSLTYAETVWFNYTAAKSDFFIYCHTIVFVFFIFSLAPLPFTALELMGLKSLEKFKIQPKMKLTPQEMWNCYKDILLLFFYVIGPLQIVSYPSLKMIGIRMGLPLPSGWEICVQLLVYILIEDYTNYWLHRFLHGKWGYENIHHVHHEYTAPTAYAATYTHWGEVLIIGIPTFLGPAIVPGHIVTFWLWIFLRQIEAIEAHSGYDFPWSPTKYIPFYGGAEHHDYHHYIGGKSRSNFASVFTYCDYIYGTDKGFRYHQKVMPNLKDLQNDLESEDSIKAERGDQVSPNKFKDISFQVQQ